MLRGARTTAIGCVLLWALLGCSAAAAQGNGRGNAFGHNKRPSSGGTPASSPSAGHDVSVPGADESFAGPSGAGVRAFGSWLDDASMMSAGSGYASFAVSYWRLPGFTEVDVPAFDVGVGLTPRLQVGASVPVYHASETGGPVVRGLGDLQLSSKIQLRDPAAGKRHQIGLAITPMIEVLGAAPSPGTSRVSWALPASVELRRTGWRTYGSAGYFSRGAVFTSGAVEVSVTNRTSVTGTISQSRSIKRDDLSEVLGLAKVRTDISGGATVVASNTIALFGSLGRTLSRVDPNRANLFVVAGLSMSFDAWKP